MQHGQAQTDTESMGRSRQRNHHSDTPLTSAVSRIPADVARKLGYYVYAYVNPLDSTIFYVGKGKGQPALSHLQDTSKSDKSPFTDVNPHGPEGVFTPAQVDKLVNVLTEIRERAAA